MIQTKCLCFLFILPFLQAQTYAGDDCVADSRSGSCMLLEKCQPLIEEVRKAGNPMPKQLIEKLRALACGFEDNDPLVCCVPAAVTPTGATSTSANAINKNGEIIGSEVPVDVSGHRNLHLLPTECGMVEDNRILGGNRTGLYEMPWMALLAYESGRRIKLSCGGSLINERYVLTAAHCVSFLSNLKLSHVIIGEHDIRQDPDCERVEGQLYCAPNARNMTIESVIAHPGYRPQTYFDDIALIRLADKVNLTFDNMKPICLPTTPELLNETLEGVQAVVAGWGATEDGLQSPVLLSVALPVVKREDCQAAYKDAIRIYKRQLCAGGLQDKDSCGGDSGGPLMYPGKTSAVGLRCEHEEGLGWLLLPYDGCSICGPSADMIDQDVDGTKTLAGQQCQNDAICVPIDKCPLLAKPLMANFINADKSSLLVSLFRRLRCDRSSICCPQIYVPGYIETQRPRPVTTTHKPIADDLLPSHKVCGKSTPDRIVGGNLTDIDEHPWLALLRYDIGHGNFGSYCGGVLISSKYVLTAAHCISGDSVPTSWKVTQVRLGEWNTSSPIDCNSNECAPPAIDVPVDYITVHEKYDPLDINQFYDIALIRLNNSVPFTDFVKPICLPEVDNKNYTGYDLEVSGWGATEIESASDVKLKVVLPVVSNEQCAKQYARAQREIRAEQICAGALNGKDSCRGDSGGPLMGKDLNGDWISIGVVSYGPTPCGTEGWPGVYTRTSSYVNWIKSNLQP